MAISLASIARGRRIVAPKMTIYGVGGIGKTTFCAGAPDPVFLMTEDGQGQLDVARFEARPGDALLRSWAELIDAVGALYVEDHGFRTVVIDSLDSTEPLLWAHTAAKHRMRDIEAFGYGKGYLHAVEEARSLLNGLDALRAEKNMAVLLIGHCAVKRFESPESEPYDRYQIQLQDRLAKLVVNWSDYVLFANYKTIVVKDESGFGARRARAVGVGDRALFTTERPAFIAKNRFDLPHEIPLSWQAFSDALAASIGNHQEPQPQQQPQPTS